MMLKRWFFVVAMALVAIFTFAQEDKNRIIEERVELIVQDSEFEDVDFTTLFDNLDSFYDNPINLNTTDDEELRELRLLNENQIYAILRYREKYGTIYSLFELSAIEEMNKEAIHTIAPFVVAKKPEEKRKIRLRNAWKYGKNELIVRHQRNLEETPAYAAPPDSGFDPNDYFFGSRDRIYMRYRYKYSKNLSAGITAEKDPGESIFGDSQPNGFDFYSFHAQVANLGILKNLVVGDFQFQAGQGLCFWSGFGYRKSPFMPTLTKRYSRGLKPYTSAEENLFLRGGGITLGKDWWEATFFYSKKKVDANLEESSENDSLEEVGFTSLVSSGFHRRPRELVDKDAVEEQVMGGRAVLKLGKFKLGVTGAQTSFGGNFTPNLQLYQKFQNTTGTWQNFGADFDWIIGKFNFYGEAAITGEQDPAYLIGTNAYLAELFTINMVYRDYPLRYQSLRSNAFGEKGSNNNERGIYTAFEMNPFRKFKLTGYLDVYEFPWLSYRKDAPSRGEEFALGGEYSISRENSITLMYRREREDINPSEYGNIRQLVNQSLTQYRVQFDYQVSKKLAFRNRIEFREFVEAEERSTGFMVYQDIYWDPTEKLDVKARVAIFETGGYDSRVYAYENDMRYQFTVPAYYGEGSRMYLLVKWKPIENLSLAVRYAQTYWTSEREIGQTPDNYLGKTRSEVKSQLILKF